MEVQLVRNVGRLRAEVGREREELLACCLCGEFGKRINEEIVQGLLAIEDVLGTLESLAGFGKGR